MALALLRDRQYTAPSAANNVSITPAGTSWGNSAYVTVLASAPSACVLTGVVVCTTYGEASAVSHGFEIDIATGAAGAEVVIATVRGANVRSADPEAGPTTCLVLPIPVDNIAAGVRIAARLRKAGTATTPPYKVSITYLRKPLASTILTTTAVPTTLPPAAAELTLTSGSPAFANGAWVQIRAATGAALIITGIVPGFASAEARYELDLGIGTAGAETVITMLHLRLGIGFPSVVMLPNPLDAVPAATRLAARLRASSAGATIACALMVLEKPV